MRARKKVESWSIAGNVTCRVPWLRESVSCAACSLGAISQSRIRAEPFGLEGAGKSAVQSSEVHSAFQQTKLRAAAC